MRLSWNQLLCAVMGCALALPLAPAARAQEADDRDLPAAEQRDDVDREDRSVVADPDAEVRDLPPAPDDRGFGSPRVDEAPPAVRDERRDVDLDRRDVDIDRRNIDLDRGDVDVERRDIRVQDERFDDARSPSDMPPAPAPIPMNNQAAPAQHYGSHYVSNPCCCGGQVMHQGGYYSQPAYRSVQAMPRGGYRSFSYEGEGAPVIAQPMTVYGGTVSSGYGVRGPVYNGANWDRFNEHDSRNFSGSYGSRASLRNR